jgi:hypothetical protein
MLALFKEMVQIIFCKTIQQLHHFCLHLFYQQQMGSLEHGFYLWKKEKVVERKIRQIMADEHNDVSTG